MATQDKAPSAPADLSKSFQRLSESAARLNKASDELSGAVAPIEAVLKRLNLGIAKWYSFDEFGPDETGDCSSLDIGYAKVGGKWCLALGERSWNRNEVGQEDFTPWPFNDAPRQLRIRAVKEIPRLLEALRDEAEKVTSALEAETAHAHEVAGTLIALANSSAGKR